MCFAHQQIVVQILTRDYSLDDCLRLMKLDIYQAIIITKNKQTEFLIQCNYKDKDDEEIINEITNSITRTVSLQLEK